jgi:leader peptidase (prepilin peptidase) / N-methyltransferase
MRFLACAAVLAWAAALTVHDLRRRRLPNALTLPGAVVILAVAAAHGRGPAAVCGALGLAALYLAVHVVAPGAMGAGDVKLAVGLGALTGAFGADVWLLGALGAPALTALFGLLAGVRTLPHGPSMCAASLVAAALALF